MTPPAISRDSTISPKSSRCSAADRGRDLYLASRCPRLDSDRIGSTHEPVPPRAGSEYRPAATDLDSRTDQLRMEIGSLSFSQALRPFFIFFMVVIVFFMAHLYSSRLWSVPDRWKQNCRVRHPTIRFLSPNFVTILANEVGTIASIAPTATSISTCARVMGCI